MGGGHVTRPDFGMPQADPNSPLTEFYLLLQKALNRSPVFMLPGAWVAFRPPADENLYEDSIRNYCTFYGVPQQGCPQIFAPAPLHVLDEELAVAPDGTPAALILTEEHTRRTTAVQLLPPVFCADSPLAAVPDSASALTLALTDEDLSLADADPARLGRALAERTAQKAWLRHPKIDAWLLTALAAAQRAYRRRL